MAALRYAARRLGGRVLQRTQAAAVEVEQRRLFPSQSGSRPSFHTVTTSGSANSNTKLRPMIDEEKEFARRVVQIEEKKEEVYNLIAELEHIYGKTDPENKELVIHLSKMVKPRPNDHKWYVHRLVKRTDDFSVYAGHFFVCGGAIYSGYFIVKSLFSSDKEADPIRNKTPEGSWQDNEVNIFYDVEPKTVMG